MTVHFLSRLPAQNAWLQHFLNGINHHMSALSALNLIWRKQTFNDAIPLRTTSLPRDCQLTAVPRMPLFFFSLYVSSDPRFVIIFYIAFDEIIIYDVYTNKLDFIWVNLNNFKRKTQNGKNISLEFMCNYTTALLNSRLWLVVRILCFYSNNLWPMHK